jgi:hypothetical protein
MDRAWTGAFGEERVIEWWTNRRRPMTAALESFDSATKEGLLSHDGNRDLIRHIGNARRKNCRNAMSKGSRCG